jgi:hypothetical protein
MADRYRTPDGWSVEVVQLTCTPDRRDGEWLRIRYLGYYVHDARSVMELERYIPLSELEDALRQPGLSSVVFQTNPCLCSQRAELPCLLSSSPCAGSGALGGTDGRTGDAQAQLWQSRRDGDETGGHPVCASSCLRPNNYASLPQGGFRDVNQFSSDS